jgi:hypothetical protein
VFWKRALTTAERAWLYNYGFGRSCYDIANLSAPTPVPSATPTPSNSIGIPLSSGDFMSIDRRFSYGEIATALAIFAAIILIALKVFQEMADKWFP